MSETWPTDLPTRFNQSGFQMGRARNSIRSTMETGPQKVRRRSTAGVKPLRGSMTMTTEQLDSFRVFYDSTLIDGNIPFDIPDPMDEDNTLLVRFDTDQPPVEEFASHDKWLVNMVLEVLP